MSDASESHERAYAQHREAHGPHGSEVWRTCDICGAPARERGNGQANWCEDCAKRHGAHGPFFEQGAPSTRKEAVEVNPSSPTPAARSLPGEVQRIAAHIHDLTDTAENVRESDRTRHDCYELAAALTAQQKLAVLGARVDAVLSKMDPLPRLNAEESLRGERIFPITNALGEIIVAWRETFAPREEGGGA